MGNTTDTQTIWNDTGTAGEPITITSSPPIVTGSPDGTITVETPTIFLGDKVVIDWDKFEGIELKVGDEIIMITKKELEEALVKLLPGLLEKLVLAKLLR